MVGCGGNLLLDRAVGAKVLLVPPKEDRGVVDYESLYKMMDEYADKLSYATNNNINDYSTGTMIIIIVGNVGEHKI